MMLTEKIILLLLLYHGNRGIFAQNVYLAGRHGRHYGRVELTYNGVNGTICDDNWDDNDAEVICRQLGLPTSNAIAKGNAYFGRGSGPIWLDEVSCSGMESNVLSCNKSDIGNNDCSHSEDAGVICVLDDFDVRLVNNYGQFTDGFIDGIVQIKLDSDWIYLPYSSHMRTNEAKVICRQLGLSTQNANIYLNHQPLFGIMQVYQHIFSYRTCSGLETKFSSCNVRDNATPLSDQIIHTTYIVCGETSNILPTLVNISMENETINVPVGEEVALVCYIPMSHPWRILQWYMSDSLVLGNATVTTSYEIAPNSFITTILKFNSSFVENGTSIGCASTTYNITTYSKKGILRTGVAVQTVEIQPTTPDIVVENSSILVSCVTSWSDPPANVQWFLNGEALANASVTESITRRDNLYRTSRTLNYTVPYQGVSTLKFRCKSINALASVAVWSAETIFKVSVQMVEIQSTTPSIVVENSSILLSCVTSWSDSQANVQWFLNGEALVNISVTESTTRRDNLFRTTSALIYTVPSQGVSTLKFRCKSVNVLTSAAIWSAESLFSVTGITVFLAGRHGRNYGRVELTYNGVNGTICDDYWDDNDAEVICRQLGLPTNATAIRNAYFGRGRGPIWLTYLRCSGTEWNILSCSQSSIGENYCSHYEDAGVICGVLDDFDVRIVNNDGQFTDGIVQIKLDSDWIYMAYNRHMGTNEAKVICRQLGLPTQSANIYLNQQPLFETVQVYRHIFSDLTCSGLETRFSKCKLKDYVTPLSDIIIPTAYIVCGETSNIIPTLVNISMENETIDVPLGEEVTLVCHTPMSRPLRILQWHIGSSFAIVNTVTMSYEIVQNGYYVTTSRLQINSSFIENGTSVRCASKTYFNNITTYSKNGIFKTGEAATSVFDMSSSSGLAGKQTFIYTSATLGITVVVLASTLACIVKKMLRLRSNDRETRQQSVAMTISGSVRSNVNEAFVAASSSNQIENCYETLEFEQTNCPLTFSKRQTSPEDAIYENTPM